MQDSCNGRFVALSDTEEMVMEMIKAVSRCNGLVLFHTLLCLLGLLGAFISHFSF